MGKLKDVYDLITGKGVTAEQVSRYLGNGITHVDGTPDRYIRDARYNTPKEEPKASEELVEKVIENTEIYREAKERILGAQRKQVAYGIDKYPEPLNASTWSMAETIDHIIDESVDKLHYLMMMKIKLEKEVEERRREYEDVECKKD